MKYFFILFLSVFVKLGNAQHTIKVRKELKIEGFFKNTQTKNNLPTYLYFTKEGIVYYTYSKKIKEKRALVKLTLCALEPSCNNYPKKNYEYKKGHIRFTTNENLGQKHFIIYDGQLSKNGIDLSIRKEESNQLIIVNRYKRVDEKK